MLSTRKTNNSIGLYSTIPPNKVPYYKYQDKFQFDNPLFIQTEKLRVLNCQFIKK
jgi:hypothetical protein